MERKRVPEAYKIMIDRLRRLENVDGKISLKTARSVMTSIFRMPSEKVATVFADMQRHGLITINGQRFIRILVEDWED